MRRLLFLLPLLSGLGFGQGIIGSNGVTGGNGIIGYTPVVLPSIVQPTASHTFAATCAQFVGSASANTCAFPINVTAGNEAYLLLTSGATTTFSAISCSSGTATIGTFTLVSGGTGPSTGSASFYRAAISGSGSCTVTATSSAAGNLGVFPFEVTNDGGVDGNPAYAYNACFVTSPCSLVGFTPGTTNDLLIGCAMGSATTTYSALNPYTLTTQGPGGVGNNTSFFCFNYTAPNTSAITPTFTQTVTSNGIQDGVLAIK